MTWADFVAHQREAVDLGFSVFSRTPHGSLLWVTTIIAAMVVTLEDDIYDEIGSAIDAFQVERRDVFKRSGRTYRSPKGWTRYCAAVEIDLIHPRIARLCSPRKVGLLAELGIDVSLLQNDQRVVVVHEHAVVDHRGHASSDALIADMRAAWPGARRVHSARLYTQGTIASNLCNLSEYTSKFRFAYSVAWDGKKTTYVGKFTDEWREFMCRTYKAIGLGRMIDANVSPQGSTARMHTDPLLPRAETSYLKPIQCSRKKETIVNTIIDITKASNDQMLLCESSDRTENDMRINEICYGFPKIVTNKLAIGADIESMIAREGPGLTTDELAIMYGDEEYDLKIAQQRLDVVKTVAAIERLRAAAARDRAEASLPVHSPTPATATPTTRSRIQGEPGGSPGSRVLLSVVERGTTRRLR